MFSDIYFDSEKVKSKLDMMHLILVLFFYEFEANYNLQSYGDTVLPLDIF